MKRFIFLAALMLLSSSADAGTFSFTVGGHRVRMEAPRHCRSLSCVSISIPGIYEARRGRDRYDGVDAAPAKPVASAPAQNSASPAIAPAKPATIAAASPPVTVGLAAAATRQAVAPSPPAIQTPQSEPARIELVRVEPLQVEPAPPIEAPAEPIRAVAEAAPKVTRVAQAADDEALETPIGEWQTEGKGDRCGSNVAAARCAAT